MSETWGWFDGPRKKYYKRVISDLIDFLYPEGSIWWNVALIILAFGTMFSHWFTIIIINLLDNGLTIQTDTFVAAMPFMTPHMLSPFYYSVIGFLLGAAFNLITILWIYTLSAFLVDTVRLEYLKDRLK